MLHRIRTFVRQHFLLATILSVFVVSVCVFVLSVTPTFAQTQLLEQFSESSRLPQIDLILFIARLIRAVLGVLGIILVILMIYAGYLYMTSQGEPAKTKKAKDVIKQATIGFVIIMSSFAIATFVINAILNATGGGQITSKAPIQKYTEPLAGSLGAGIIESHYPPRNAIDIPRNTKVFVTFKEPIDPSTIIQDYDLELAPDDTNQSKLLNTDTIWLFETAKGKDQKLPPEAVMVYAVADATPGEFTTFVFDPVDLLGSAVTDTNYTMALQPGVEKADGTNAFVGAYATGYGWTFEVSTIVDLTPPKVLTVIPKNNSTKDRNIVVEMTFNEAMDPVSSTGMFDTILKKKFTNISVLDSGNTHVEGSYKISNGYRTVSFVSNDPCAEDPCGNTIYCLPGGQEISVVARAATIDPLNIPQALLGAQLYDGLTDAAGNSLDGNGDGTACGSVSDKIACTNGDLSDDYRWDFTTTNEIDDTIPQVLSLNPKINAQNIDQNASLEVQFNTLLLTPTSTDASLWPDPLYSMWFYTGKTDTETESTVLLYHPAFISNAEGGYDYYPVLTQGIRSAYQICMYPAKQVGGSCNGSAKYCCNGNPSTQACQTQSGQGQLPGNSCGGVSNPELPYCCSGTPSANPC